jgi:hypothetical protein
VVAQFAGAGNVTAPLVTTNDVVLEPTGDPGSGTAGCEEADWGGQDLTGKIALIERGTCAFVDKINLAKDLGAAAVYTALQSGPVNVTFSVNTTTEEFPQFNPIADSKWGDPERTIVVGAHLDSVEEGPGVNDNGSSTATDIEVAEQIAKLKKKPRNRLRFAFWGAEEAGLVGSTAYVADLIDSGEIDDVEANLNFDMLASPNFVRFVYDGDNSTGEGDVGPPGSAEIEQLFLRYFASQGLATDPTAFDGRSDYGPFIRRRHWYRPVACSQAPRGQDRGAGGRLRRRCRVLVRPVLPPGVRHARHGCWARHGSRTRTNWSRPRTPQP